MESIIGFIVVLIIILIYMLPTIVGHNKRNASAIVTLNLLLGWTVVGWVISLVWAMTKDVPSVVIQQNLPPTETELKYSKLDALDRIQKLKVEGVLTEEEFRDQKRRILDGEKL